MPRPVAKASSVVRERESDVAAARAAVDEAKRGVQQAAGDDRALLADALDRGAGDPGTPKTDAAYERVAEAERLLAAEELRQQRAREALDVVLSQSIDGWVAAVTKSVEQAEVECSTSSTSSPPPSTSARATTRARMAARLSAGREVAEHRGGADHLLDVAEERASLAVRVPLDRRSAAAREGGRRASDARERARPAGRERAAPTRRLTRTPPGVSTLAQAGLLLPEARDGRQYAVSFRGGSIELDHNVPDFDHPEHRFSRSGGGVAPPVRSLPYAEHPPCRRRSRRR